MIQGVEAVREDLLVLVKRGRDDQVVSEGLLTRLGRLSLNLSVVS